MISTSTTYTTYTVLPQPLQIESEECRWIRRFGSVTGHIAILKVIMVDLQNSHTITLNSKRQRV